jgi:hypothetical protein
LKHENTPNTKSKAVAREPQRVLKVAIKEKEKKAPK